MTPVGFAADRTLDTCPVIHFGPGPSTTTGDPSVPTSYLGVARVRSDCFVTVCLDAHGQHTDMVRRSTSWEAEFEALLSVMRSSPAQGIHVRYGHPRIYHALLNMDHQPRDRTFGYARQFIQTLEEKNLSVQLTHHEFAQNKAVRYAQRTAERVKNTGNFSSWNWPTIEIQPGRGHVRAKGADLDVQVRMQDHPFPYLELIMRIALGASPLKTYRIKGMSVLTQFHWKHPADAPEEARTIIDQARRTLASRSVGLHFV